MDMFDSESFDNKLDMRNDEVSIAKGEWLHLEMNLRTVVHQGNNFIKVFTRSSAPKFVSICLSNRVQIQKSNSITFFLSKIGEEG